MAVLLAVAYLPLLLTRPGQVGADTKSYLYLDPGRLLSRAPYMWDPNVGLGTVTHQNIGYLWPMGPYYWLMDAIAVPDWIAQRLWIGSIIALAGLGVRFMLRELRWQGAGVTVASFAYAFSPYLLDYAARISVILLPFAGLPWLIGLAARSLRRNDWRTPAVFALVTLTVGGVNATSLLLVMVGPMLWFPYAVFVEREVSLRDAVRAALRITVLTVATSLWWVAGLALQGSFGIPILRYTETYQTVANASLSTELLRGLGYWFFYGTDGLGAWTESSATLVESVPALALSFLLPVLGIIAVLLTRWRHRVFFAAVMAVGMILAVGAHPWDESSPYGGLFRTFTGGDLGLSFRSTPRAVPLIALGTAVFLGAGIAAVSRWRPQLHLPLAGLMVVLVCLNMSPLFRQQFVDRNLQRDSEVPSYWVDAARSLDAGDRDTRVWELPGIDFAAYRWGNTVDPITPGLMDREFVARELIPYGTPPSADMVNATDQPFQSAVVEPSAIAPLARLMGIGDLLVRADLQYERYRVARPRMVARQMERAPGLGPAEGFGEPVPNVADPLLPLDDEMEYSIDRDTPDPAPVTIYSVLDPRPILRTVSASAPSIVAGDASGLVSMASLGALPADRPVFYAASFTDDPSGVDAQLDEADSTLVVTDTNRRQARRWGTVRDNDGYTERGDESPLVDDPTDNRLEVFPDERAAEQSVTEQIGGASVSASAYGNGVSYTAGDRAVNAFDGDESTAWRVAAFDDPLGEFIDLRVDEPITTDRMSLLQVQGPKNRFATKVSLSFDGGDPVQVELSEASRIAPGQEVTFPQRSFSRLRITIDATNLGPLTSYRGISDVGFAEVDLPGLGPVSEVVRPPTALLEAAGATSIDRALLYAFDRRASADVDVLAADEEPTMQRWVIGPVARSFSVFGRSRISASLADDRIDALLGLESADQGGVTASASVRLPGDLGSRASSAIDGDPTTAYQTPLNPTAGTTIEVTYAEPRSVDGLQMQVVADEKHSVPTKVSLSVDGGPPRSVELDPVPSPFPVGTQQPRGATQTLTVPTGPVEGTTFTLTIDEIDEITSPDWFSKAPVVLPVAIVESGLPVVERPDPSTMLDDACRDDLVRIDDRPVPVRLVGTVGTAGAGDSVELRGCDGAEVALDEGRHLLATDAAAGVDVDQLALFSAAGGAPGPDLLETPLSEGPEPPTATTERSGRNSYRTDVGGAEEPYWIVLGQSNSPGWTATTSDGTDLGEPILVNGYANAWRIDPDELGADVSVSITWAPQRWVWWGLGLSALGVLVCLALALWPRRRPVTQVIAAEMTPRIWFDDPGPDSAASIRTTVLVSVMSGLAGWLFVGPVPALALAVLAALALRWRRGSWVLTGVVIALVGAASGYIVARQWHGAYDLDFNWMERFEVTHQWTLTAVLGVLLVVVVDRIRRRTIP